MDACVRSGNLTRAHEALGQLRAAGLQPNVRPPKVLATARGVYQGGALYYASLSLPHLGDFALTAKLGGEPIGYP